VNRIHLDQYRAQWRVLVYKLLNIRIIREVVNSSE